MTMKIEIIMADGSKTPDLVKKAVNAKILEASRIATHTPDTMKSTLNKDGTTRKTHKKGAGRPETGRTARLGLKIRPETLEAIRAKAKASGLSVIETIERKFPAKK